LAGVLISRNRAQTSLKPEQQGEVQTLHQLKRAGLRQNNVETFEALIRPLNLNGDPIKLIGIDQLVGRDASLASIVVDDPSVAGIHARLIRQADGDYLIKDQGSVSGTWVNYHEVGDEGIRLRHEDRIQIGRISFIFELPAVTRKSSIQVVPVSDPNQTALKDQIGERNDQN
jgi:pSer/pThr/pTyr-binding forkhead associated (FHA) protein